MASCLCLMPWPRVVALRVWPGGCDLITDSLVRPVAALFGLLSILIPLFCERWNQTDSQVISCFPARALKQCCHKIPTSITIQLPPWIKQSAPFVASKRTLIEPPPLWKYRCQRRLGRTDTRRRFDLPTSRNLILFFFSTLVKEFENFCASDALSLDKLTLIPPTSNAIHYSTLGMQE